MKNLKLILFCIASVTFTVCQAHAACGGGGNKKAPAAKVIALESAEVVDLDATIVTESVVRVADVKKPSKLKAAAPVNQAARIATQ
jgi:hypothetical protein